MNINGLTRHIEPKVENLLKHFPVVAIIGVRQAGKTELTKQIRPSWKYVDLEKPEDFDLISRDPSFFFQQHSQNIIIDEAQEYPELFRVLRGVIDSKRQQKGRFILTGSSSMDLLKNISESLAGRIAIVELGTLKASEFYQTELSPFYEIFNQKLDKRNVRLGLPPLTNQQMQYVWLKGGYPEPLLSDSDTLYFQWLENYQKTYINRDIAKLFPRLNKLTYRRFLTMLGQLSGRIINRSDLGRAINVSESTIKEYLEIAEGTFLWRSFQSLERNISKSVVKMPKGYLRDTGLLNYFLKIQTEDDLFNNIHVGQSFEAFVIEELIKGLHATMLTNWDYHYYRTRGGAEVDLVLSGPFGTLPIEIKSGVKVQKQQLRSLTEFVAARNLPFGILLNQSQEATWLTETVLQVPIGYL